MTDRLAEPENQARYRRRQALVEPVIAHIKCNRRLDRFLLRGEVSQAGFDGGIIPRVLSSGEEMPHVKAEEVS